MISKRGTRWLVQQYMCSLHSRALEFHNSEISEKHSKTTSIVIRNIKMINLQWKIGDDTEVFKNKTKLCLQISLAELHILPLTKVQNLANTLKGFCTRVLLVPPAGLSFLSTADCRIFQSSFQKFYLNSPDSYIVPELRKCPVERIGQAFEVPPFSALLF